MLDLKTGKLPHLGDPRDYDAAKMGLTLGEVQIPNGELGNFELIFGETQKSEAMLYDFTFPLGMWGNDRIGDCVPCAVAGSENLDSIEGKHVVRAFNTEVVEQGYGEVTGWTAGDPSSDQGTEIRAYLNYHLKKGIPDAAGRRDKMGLFGQLKRGDIESLLKTIVVTGKSPIGILVPNYFMDQFNAKEPFAIKKNATRQQAEIDGGHCILVVGTIVVGGVTYLVVRTWGTLALMTFDAYQKFCDESWIYFSSMFLRNGKTISGLNKEQSLHVVESA